MPYKKGQRLPHQAANNFDETYEWYRRFKKFGEGGANQATAVNFSKVSAANYTSQQIYIGDVCEFDGNPFADIDPAERLPDPRNDRWVKAVTPDTTRIGWGIALEPIVSAGGADREGGSFLVLGACHARVVIEDEGHEYAERRDGFRTLFSCSKGPVKILHKPAAVGALPEERCCLVQIMDEGGASDVVFFVLTETLRINKNEPNHATASTIYLDPETGDTTTTDDSFPIEVFDIYKGIDTPTKGMFNGYSGYKGCAVKTGEVYEADGRNAIVGLTIPADWWDDAGEFVLSIDGNSTGTINFPNDVFPQTVEDFDTNLSGGVTTAIGSGQVSFRWHRTNAGASVYLEIEFIDTHANMAVPVSLTSWSHTSSVSPPVVSTVTTGTSTPFTLPRYEIIWMERPAQWVDVEATAYMAEFTELQITHWTAEVDVNLYDNQGKFPNSVPSWGIAYANTEDPGIGVVDSREFGDVITGCVIHLKFDNENERYVIDSAEHMVERATAYLSETACGGEGEFAVAITTFSGISVGQFNALPSDSPTSALNPNFLPGKNGDKVLLRRVSSEITFDGVTNNPDYGFLWEVVNVDPHEVTLDLGTHVEGTQLVKQTLLVKVWTCAEPESVVIGETTEDCP